MTPHSSRYESLAQRFPGLQALEADLHEVGTDAAPEGLARDDHPGGRIGAEVRSSTGRPQICADAVVDLATDEAGSGGGDVEGNAIRLLVCEGRQGSLS